MNTIVCRLVEAAGARVRIWLLFFGVSTFSVASYLHARD